MNSNDKIFPVNWCHYVGKSLHPKKNPTTTRTKEN